MSVADGQIVPGDGGVRGYMSAGANYAGFGIRGLWLIVVYWLATGLAVMILGAHQFHLKVAASASANPASALTIGELISKRTEYRGRQDTIEALEAERQQKAKEIAKLRQYQLTNEARAIALQSEAYAVARDLMRAALAAMDPARAPKQADLDNMDPPRLAEWARTQPQTPETTRLGETYSTIEQAWRQAGIASSLTRQQLSSAEKDLQQLDDDLKTKTIALKNFLLELRPVNQSGPQAGNANGASGNGNGSNIVGLLYELDSFRNLGFFWFGEVDPLKFVTLPGSVLTLLLALAMGALGSTLFVTGEYFRSNGTRPMAWYFFRPFLGMITALAVFVAFKAGQLTMAGVSPNSGVEMDLNPFLVSFFAVIAGLLSEHAIARLSLIGRDWLNRIGKDSKPDAAPGAAANGAAPLYAKNWETHFATGSGKSVEGLVAALRADPARVEAWMSHREPVPVEVHEELVKYFGLTKDEILAPGDR